MEEEKRTDRMHTGLPPFPEKGPLEARTFDKPGPPENPPSSCSERETSDISNPRKKEEDFPAVCLLSCGFGDNPLPLGVLHPPGRHDRGQQLRAAEEHSDSQQSIGHSWGSWQLPRVGTALAVLTQFSFVTAVWLSYTQALWLNLRRTAMSRSALDAAFGANESILFVRNMEMLRKFKSGSILALLAWCLLLPAFFTPATLYVKPLTQESVRSVPQLVISDPSEGHRFAYSPPTERNATRLRGDDIGNKDQRRTFAGPRTTLSLTATAAASMGGILTIPVPHARSNYGISSFGPAVRCSPANLTLADMMNGFLRRRWQRSIALPRKSTMPATPLFLYGEEMEQCVLDFRLQVRRQ